MGRYRGNLSEHFTASVCPPNSPFEYRNGINCEKMAISESYATFIKVLLGSFAAEGFCSRSLHVEIKMFEAHKRTVHKQ